MWRGVCVNWFMTLRDSRSKIHKTSGQSKQSGVDMEVLNQDFVFSRKPQFLLLRCSTN